MKYRDYYEILGIPRNATEKEIKRAYRELARQCHPDLHPGDKAAENRFKDINEAYEILSDEEKRSHYDRFGSTYEYWQRNGNRAAGFDWGQWASNVGEANTDTRKRSGRNFRVEYDTSGGIFSDIFNGIFGERAEPKTQKTPIRGRDVEVVVKISLEEAYKGTTRKISNGESNHLFTAHIQPGVQDGTKIRFGGQGKRGFAGGEKGDLFAIIEIETHPIFTVEGDDIFMDLKLDMYSAVLGGEVRIPTLAGDVKLKVPAGTQSGQRIRLAGKGMPRLRDSNQYGDLYVRPLVQIPTDLSDAEYDLFERLRKLRPNG